jgi:hypothetical protein
LEQLEELAITVGDKTVQHGLHRGGIAPHIDEHIVSLDPETQRLTRHARTLGHGDPTILECSR